MANEEQLAILRQGVDKWNTWRENNPSVKIDLQMAKLSGVILSGIDLNEGDLRGAILRDANLVKANLIKANLKKTKLSGANLSGGVLQQAQLSVANLRRANLGGTNLRFANLENADLTEARLWATDLTGAYLNGVNLSNASSGHNVFTTVDLSQVTGLTNVSHDARSFIDITTFHRSKGNIPEIFLRGCGLNDLDIEFSKLANPNLTPEKVTEIIYKIHKLYTGDGIQYYSCFISYSSKDQNFAKRLYDDLQNHGIRCWFAPKDLKIGDKIRPRIDQEIRLRDKLLVILSRNSVKSEWVGDEVEAALEEESTSNRLVLFPIRVDDTVMNARDDWAAKIKRRRHIGNFLKWKDDESYQEAFRRLLEDLKVPPERDDSA